MNRTQRRKIILRYGVILVFGIVVRMIFIFSSHFPLNDGGLFLSMIQDIETNNGAMPLFNSYNDISIPFAYPPLAFYVVYFLQSVLPFDSLDFMIYFPAILSCLTLAAFIPIAKNLLKDEREILTALLLFALFPRSFIWMIMGGGLTRALGFFFALLSIACGLKLYTTKQTRYAILCGITSALTVLSHLENAWFVVFSLGLLILLKGRSRKSYLQSILVIILVALFTSPWWIFILQNHGVKAFMSAFLTRSNEWELWLPMLRYMVLGLLGILVCLRKREYFLPLWLPLIFLLDPRSAQTIACVPLSILLSLGIWFVLCPSFMRLRGVSDLAISDADSYINLANVWPFRKFDASFLTRTLDRMLMFFVFVAFFSVGIDYLGASITLQALSEHDIRMMAWIRDEIPPDQSFLIVSGEGWQKDEVSEWFPVLTDQVSLATVQGYEWTSASRFYNQWQAHNEAQDCLWDEDVGCILKWRSVSGKRPDYLYYSITRTDFLFEMKCCEEMLDQCLQSEHLEMVHAEGETILFRIIP